MAMVFKMFGDSVIIIHSHLANRLETRKAVDKAKSILQRDLSLSEDDAYQMMHRESRQRRKSMREIADAILLSEELRRQSLT